MSTKNGKKTKRRKLWSVPRIIDPRYPNIMLRVAELRPDGILYVIRMLGDLQRMRSLGVTRKDLGSTPKQQEEQARARALSIIEAMATGAPFSNTPSETSGQPLTLGQLATEYEKHGLHGRSESYRKEQPKKIRRLVEFLGLDREVRSLCKSDVERFSAARLATGVKQGTVWHDLVGLKCAINWATEHRRENGAPLIETNPLSKLRVRQEPKPLRPVVDEARYLALKKVAPNLPVGFELALALAWGSGHRIGSIISLRWADICFETTEQTPHGSIRWSAEFDKTRSEHVTPMNALTREALCQAKPDIVNPSAWLFPAAHDPDKRMDRRLASEWLQKAERRAGLKHIRGSGWHAFRRAWATRRKHYPLKDVAEAGGWKDTATLLRAYTQSDPETVLSVVEA